MTLIVIPSFQLRITHIHKIWIFFILCHPWMELFMEYSKLTTYSILLTGIYVPTQLIFEHS
jgi:hypothetical protein